MKKVERIVLNGQNYVTPKTESVEIVMSHCVLAGSGVSLTHNGNLSGFSKGQGF